MKEKITSIFTIERRKDFSVSFTKFLKDLKTMVNTSAGVHCQMLTFLERCIRYWPYRCGATGIDDYLEEIGVEFTELEEDRDLLLTMELLINLLHWAPKQDNNDDPDIGFGISLKKDDVKMESDRLLQNAEYLLEQCCNMTVREEFNEVFPKYFITKRDAHVDAAVVAVPELKDILLGYLDIRNADDIEYKKSALTAIYKYMEPHRKEYKGLACSAISEEFFTSMNTFGIRHNTKSQIRMHKKKRIAVCDRLFMMAVYALQTREVNQYKNELLELRNKA